MHEMTKRVIVLPSLLTMMVAGSSYAQTSDDQSMEQVGQPPPAQETQPEIQSIPDIGGVLTPQGRFVLEPEFQYSHSSVNRLTFRGIEILSTLLVGALYAEDVDRDTWTTSLTGRLGVTNRLELELKVPYVYREDTVNNTIAEVTPSTNLTSSRSGDGLGDIEVAAHYQLNRNLDGGPFYIGNLRYKSTTGKSPFEIDRTDVGIERELATGSGFHSIEPSLTILFPSDPAVYFANIGYLYNIKDDVNERIGDFVIGEVDPGDAIRLSFGMAYSINQKSSFTLGYKNDFIGKTDTEFTNPDTGVTTTQTGASLNIGSMLLGWSYQLDPDVALSLNLEFGITDDAPDTTLTLRAPFGFDMF
ncbi:transporter [Halomonas sp. I5-271120]|uniref:transporter n=1 Tax=Halomonas sp. I5-271120 TaxID=3061632 RepID=UPI00271509CD|nr:transporter [Halomonas sp. I5-271120]